LVAAALLPLSLPAQTKVTTSGRKGAANSDNHVKMDNWSNAPGAKVAPPAKKGGPAAKGPYGTCTVDVDNRTPWIVQFYFQGSAAGVVGPWGDLYPNITPGTAQLYGRATFTDGSSLTFGPETFVCNGQDFHWSLTP
jgi:hypothetical protein